MGPGGGVGDAPVGLAKASIRPSAGACDEQRQSGQDRAIVECSGLAVTGERSHRLDGDVGGRREERHRDDPQWDLLDVRFIVIKSEGEDLVGLDGQQKSLVDLVGQKALDAGLGWGKSEWVEPGVAAAGAHDIDEISDDGSAGMAHFGRVNKASTTSMIL